jgi:hypothetical protein
MTIRTQLKAGRIALNHNEALQVRSALKAGEPGHNLNHNEALQVTTSLKAEGWTNNHNEAMLRDSYRPVIAMRRLKRTAGRKSDRLELLVIRASLRAGRRASGRKAY